MRQSTIKRTTNETTINLSINLDQPSTPSIDTGIAFLDHMLTLFAFHSGITLSLKAEGDLQIDSHHTVEDIGIVLGEAFKKALGDKLGITRYADNLTPMDESLIRGALDISNRPCLVYDDQLTRENLGDIACENFKEFFIAFTNNARITLHLAVLYGENDHHKIEGIFKSLGRLVRNAIVVKGDSVTSTKGVI